MRVTNRMTTDNSVRNINESLDELYTLQQKAASGKKYLRTSENPAVTADNLTLNSSLRSINTYSNVISATEQWMETSEFALNHMTTILSKAQAIMLKGLDDSYSTEERKTMAAEIDGVLNQAVDLANYKDQDNYVFSGTKTNTKPFTLVKASDPTSPTVTVSTLATDGVTTLTKTYHVDTVVYNGDSNSIQRSVGPSENTTVNINGSEAFVSSTQGGNVYNSATSDMFATLIRVRDYLNSEDYLKMHVSSGYIQPTPTPPETAVPADTSGIDPTTVTPAYTSNDVLDRDLLSDAYTSLQNVYSKVAGYMTTNGSRLKNLQTSQDRADKAALEIKSILSKNEDVNVAEIISEIKHQELIYNATIQMSGQIGSMLTLFDALA